MKAPVDDLKREVRQFYDQVGWQRIGECCFQNARFEDLRPVSRDYIHRCHLRVGRHLQPQGRFLLDAGSGPIQYPEYLTYSRGYTYRVCVDLSIVALREAKARIPGHGLCVVADVAHLPFAGGVFGGLVSLHTVQHLPLEEHPQAYRELYRVLAWGCEGVVVNRWRRALLMDLAAPLLWLMGRVVGTYRTVRGLDYKGQQRQRKELEAAAGRGKTRVQRYNYPWLKQAIGREIPFEIFVWRSVSTPFLRTLIHPRLGGRALLRLIYALEERFPRWMGIYGQYPMVVLSKREQP